MSTVSSLISFLRPNWSAVAAILSTVLAVALPNSPAVVADVLQLLTALFGGGAILKSAIRQQAAENFKAACALCDVSSTTVTGVAAAHGFRQTRAAEWTPPVSCPYVPQCTSSHSAPAADST
ncbi:hypothetical protein [Paludisphaera borealis]|uniref:Holin n=1 Tax=Paludisphaera borealis TaxID=1387353 RepID=A0A1U7CWC5_9BACT|nr:hypothetical protein [Paludisphaera borealis]APW63244.1 hypothetical protein BSF38_04808 [Paludisphaera borealis]